MSRAVAVIALLIFGVVAVNGLAIQYESAVRGSQPLQSVENETFTVDHGTEETLSESNRDVVYAESVDVYQNNSSVSPAGNYSWRDANGTLFIPSDSALTDNRSANVTYGYREPSGQQQAVRDITLLPIELGGGLGIMAAAALLIAAFALARRQS